MLRIAQIAPLAEAIPPRLYGGTERIVSYLTEELVRQGHEVTLFASGDSRTSARLVACCPRAQRRHSMAGKNDADVLAMLEEVRRHAGCFDVLHFHIEQLHFPIFRDIAARTLTTLHGRLDSPELQPLFRSCRDFPLVSISSHQRRPLPAMNWLATIPHGLPLDLLRPAAHRNEYLAFLGRLSPEKRPDLAIEIARRSNLPIRIAAKVDDADCGYFERYIRPLLQPPAVQFLGEIGEAAKGEFLGNARALLFPIDWPEPFGIVMIEAMACGTPVIAFRRGSVPEVVEDGVTGFSVSDVSDAVRAVTLADRLDRPGIRRRFEQRFSDTRMTGDYVEIYRSLVSGARVRCLGRARGTNPPGHRTPDRLWLEQTGPARPLTR